MELLSQETLQLIFVIIGVLASLFVIGNFLNQPIKEQVGFMREQMKELKEQVSKDIKKVQDDNVKIKEDNIKIMEAISRLTQNVDGLIKIQKNTESLLKSKNIL